MIRPAWFDAGLVAAIADLPLATRVVAAGSTAGRHPSRLPGAGLEFAQYRGYQPGDDIRRVDWKLLARSDRLYVREADAETALPVVLVLDASASMNHVEAGVRKFDAARAVIAALAATAIRHGDLAALVILGPGGRSIGPSRDHRQLERIIDALDHTEPRGAWQPGDAMRLSEFGRATALIAVTDGHDPGEAFLDATTRATTDVTLLLLRTPRETDLDYGRTVTLEDLETGERVTLTPGLTHARVEADRRWQARAAQLGCAVVSLDPTAPLTQPLRTYLGGRAGRR
jgi:uncharacterized protein (DUF58 family)